MDPATLVSTFFTKARNTISSSTSTAMRIVVMTRLLLSFCVAYTLWRETLGCQRAVEQLEQLGLRHLELRVIRCGNSIL
jgi:hypothetical protein